jgi:hypothetical protein
MIDALNERRERWGLSYFVAFAGEPWLERFIDVVRRLAA